MLYIQCEGYCKVIIETNRKIILKENKHMMEKPKKYLEKSLG